MNHGVVYPVNLTYQSFTFVFVSYAVGIVLLSNAFCFSDAIMTQTRANSCAVYLGNGRDKHLYAICGVNSGIFSYASDEIRKKSLKSVFGQWVTGYVDLALNKCKPAYMYLSAVYFFF